MADICGATSIHGLTCNREAGHDPEFHWREESNHVHVWGFARG